MSSSFLQRQLGPHLVFRDDGGQGGGGGGALRPPGSECRGDRDGVRRLCTCSGPLWGRSCFKESTDWPGMHRLFPNSKVEQAGWTDIKPEVCPIKSHTSKVPDFSSPGPDYNCLKMGDPGSSWWWVRGPSWAQHRPLQVECNSVKRFKIRIWNIGSLKSHRL